MSQQSDPSARAGAIAWMAAAAMVLIPLAHSGILSDPFGLPKRALFIALAIILAAVSIYTVLFREGSTCASRAALVPALLLLAGGAIGWALSFNRPLSVWGLVDIAAGVTVFLGMTRFVRTLDGARLFFNAALISGTLVAIAALAQIFIPGFNLTLAGFSILPASQGGATLGDAGLMAQFLVLTLPLGIGAAAMNQGVRRSVCGAGLGLITAALWFAGRPEGLLIGLLVACLVLATRALQVLFRVPRRPADLIPALTGSSVRAVLVAAIALVAALSLSHLPGVGPAGSGVAPLMDVSLLSPTMGDPKDDRTAAARGTVSLVAAHPLGVGPALWRHAFLEVAWTGAQTSPFTLNHQLIHPGNDYLEILAETGILGGLALISLILILLLQSGMAATSAPSGWGTVGLVAFNALAALAILATLGSPLHEPATTFVFWVCAAFTQLALARADPAPGPPAPRSFLRPHERPMQPIDTRRRAPAWVAAAFWVLAAAGLTIGTVNRARASHQTLMGNAALQAGAYQIALEFLGRPAVRRSPEYLPRVLAGTAYLRLGFPEGAAREFGEALARSPYFVAAYLGRAGAYESAGRYDLADDDLQAALRIWPGNKDTLLALGRLNTTRGRLDAALDTYREIARRSSSLAEPYFRMGEIFARRGQIDEAIESFRVCGMKNPRYPKLQMHLGDAFYRKGLIEMALRYYTGAAAQDEKDVTNRLKIANAQHALGQHCEARESLEAARDLEPDPVRRGTILDLIDSLDTDCRKQKRQQGVRP